jgi:hypothetical protein
MAVAGQPVTAEQSGTEGEPTVGNHIPLIIRAAGNQLRKFSDDK